MKKKNILLILILLSINLPIFAENWVNTQNKTPPVVFIDMDSIHRYNGKIIYAVRYFEKNSGDTVVTILADVDSKTAGIMNVQKYFTGMAYNYSVPFDINMKKINKDSSLYNSFEKVKDCAKRNKINDYSDIPPVSDVDEISITKKNIKHNAKSNAKPDFDLYMKELQRQIKRNWKPPKDTESKRIVVLFKVSKNGALLSQNVYNSSGNSAADNAALEAVKLAAPFKPLPPEFKGESVDIQFTFDYNVFGANSVNNSDSIEMFVNQKTKNITKNEPIKNVIKTIGGVGAAALMLLYPL